MKRGVKSLLFISRAQGRGTLCRALAPLFFVLELGILRKRVEARWKINGTFEKGHKNAVADDLKSATAWSW